MGNSRHRDTLLMSLSIEAAQASLCGPDSFPLEWVAGNVDISYEKKRTKDRRSLLSDGG